MSINANLNSDLAEVYMCRSQTGMSSVIGNEIMIIRDYIVSLFPKDFFKDEYIETMMVQKEMDMDIITKKRKPCLVIKPKVTLEDESVFGKLPDWVNTRYFQYKRLQGNYMPVLKDDENQIYMYCSGDRLKISYEIEIFVETKMKQLNTAYFLKGSALHKSYFYLNETRMETEIPKYYIKNIANVMNYDLSIPEERSNFNFYLNEHSQKFIQEKIKLSSGNYSHFYLYKSNILCLFTGYPDIDDGEQQGMLNNNFRISENLDTEFWTPHNYFLEIGKKFTPINVKNYDFIEDVSDGVRLHYTINFAIPEKIGNMEYHNKIMYVTDEDPTQDQVDISQLFSDKDKAVIHYATTRKILLSEIFHIDLYYNKYKVDDTSIVIDWEKYILTNIRPKVNDCYTLVVYVDRAKYNRTIRVLEHLSGKEYDKNVPL